jgi:hypothetical protein
MNSRWSDNSIPDAPQSVGPARAIGGTRKIADLPTFCQHFAHNPPGMMVYEPGVYEHVCPNCGARQIFTVGSITA